MYQQLVNGKEGQSEERVINILKFMRTNLPGISKVQFQDMGYCISMISTGKLYDVDA